jgi:phosphatidylserine decarboxylase
MISARSWRIARRYATPPAAVGVGLLARSRRRGWAWLGTAAAVTLFFRDPDRPAEREDDLVYAPADGIVKDVGSAEDPWLPSGDALRIATFLTIFDVHVNRSPVAGTISAAEEHHGRHRAAFAQGVAEHNHRLRLCVDGPRGRAVVVPMAGMLARRITRWVEVGEHVAAGQRLGLIHFGSRTDVLLPAGAAVPLVRRGQRVRAGITPIARYLPREAPAS